MNLKPTKGGYTMKYGLTRIETQTDFIMWNNYVNQPKPILCDLQDIFSRSNEQTLINLFIDQNRNDRELTVFTIQKCMGSETLMRFIRVYIMREAEKYIESESAEINSGWNKLITAKNAFEAEKVCLETKNSGLENTIEDLRSQLSLRSQTASEYLNRVYELESDNEKLKQDVDRLSQFEHHIQGLLVGDHGRQVISV